MWRFLVFSFTLLYLTGCTPKAPQTPDLPSTLPDSETQPISSSIEPDSNLVFSVPVKSSYFTADKLNQLYLVTERNEIIKYDSKGKEVFRYNNNFLDNLTHVDVTDPFNILLYYPDYLTVITLDRTMNKTGEFDFSNLNLLRVKAIGSSNDNNVWIYDEVDFKLKKVNRSGAVLRQSVNLNLQLSHSPKPNFLLEKENAVYLNDPEYGILVFNVFGEYQNTIELKGIQRFQVFDNQLIYKKDTQVFSYHLQTLNQKRLVLPVIPSISDEVLIQKNRLFLRKADRVEVYNIQ